MVGLTAATVQKYLVLLIKLWYFLGYKWIHQSARGNSEICKHWRSWIIRVVKLKILKFDRIIAGMLSLEQWSTVALLVFQVLCCVMYSDIPGQVTQHRIIPSVDFNRGEWQINVLLFSFSFKCFQLIWILLNVLKI